MQKKSIVPDWLAVIKKGYYTMAELCYLTGKKQGHIYIRLRTLGVDFKIVKCGLRSRHKIYMWKGAVYYWDKYSSETRRTLLNKIRKKEEYTNG